MAEPHSVPQMECEHCHRMLDHCACPEPEPADLNEMTACSDQHLRDFISVYGGHEEAAMAIGERIAAAWDRQVATSTILAWLQSRIGDALTVE